MNGRVLGVLTACLVLPVCAWGQGIIMGTSFENSEGWETHPKNSNLPWWDTLLNTEVWEGNNLHGGYGDGWVSWVREGSSDGVNFPDPMSGARCGVLELHETLDPGDESYIKSDLVTNPGVVSFWATKSHRTAGGMEVQVSADGSTWETVRYISAEGDAAEIDKKLYWDPFDININREGDYRIRWIKTIQGATFNSKIFIDDIHLHPYETPIYTPTPTSTPTPAPEPNTLLTFTTSFESSEGWETHANYPNWIDYLDNGHRWEGKPLPGGASAGEVREGAGDSETPAPRTGTRQAKLSYLAGIVSGLTAGSGTFSFYVSKSHDSSGKLQFQYSADGTTWVTALEIDDGELGTLMWRQYSVPVGQSGTYQVRWTKSALGATPNSYFYVDDITKTSSVTTDVSRAGWEVYR